MTGFSPSTVTVRPAACSWLSSTCAAIPTAIPSRFNSTAAGRSCSARSFFVRTRAAAEIGSELGSAVVRAADRWRTPVGDIDGFDDLDPIAECLDLDCFSWLPSPRTRSLSRWRAMDRRALGRTGGAAVDHDLGAGHVCRVTRREIEHRLRDVLGFAHAGEWHAAPPRLMPGPLDTALVVCLRRRNPGG